MSPIASLSSRTAPPAMPCAAERFKQLDTGGKGYITADDLKAAQRSDSDSVSISEAGARAADKRPDAERMIQQMDSNGDGQLTRGEFESGVEKAKAEQANGPPAGAPRGGGKGPQGGGGAGGASSAGSSSTGASYEAADTNQDGKVSELERLAYDTKHPKSPGATAVKAYQDVAAAMPAQGSP